MPPNTARTLFGQFRRGLRGIFDSVFDRAVPLPKNVPTVVVGKSVQGRDISTHSVGTGKSTLLFVGGLHGNEVGGVKTAHALLRWLPQQTKWLKEFTFWVIPCLNPDGYAEAQQHPDYLHDGRIGRFNANGVDMNRNFPTASFQSHSEWTHGKAYSERTDVYAGPHGGSEPEIQTLLSFIEAQKINLLAMFHTAGADVTGSKDAPAQRLTQAYAEAAGYRYFSEEEWRALGHTGSAKEWCEQNGVTFLEIEGSTRWESDWGRHRKGIEALFRAL
jgi:predicted deacylase